MQVIVPMLSSPEDLEPYTKGYPLPLLELGKRTLIERVVENLKNAFDATQFIFIAKQEHLERFHLDSTLATLTERASTTIPVKGATGGAVCSAMLAVDQVDPEAELLIVNYTQLFSASARDAFNVIRADGVGVLCHESVHPRWSYVRKLDSEYFCEVREKDPISKLAIAGLYYFSTARIFMESARSFLLKGPNFGGKFYLSGVLNEAILDGHLGRYGLLGDEEYFPLYSQEHLRRLIDLESGNVGKRQH